MRVKQEVERTMEKGLVRRSALTEQVYDVLKERIIDGVLQPGVRLNIDGFARELQVSNIPVREALARLYAEKLVVGEPFKGYVVRPMLTLDRLYQLFDTRILVESHAARVGAARVEDAMMHQMRDTQMRIEQLQVGPNYLEFKAFTVCDHDFHTLIVASSGNEVLTDLYESLSVHIQLSRLYAIRGSVDYEEALQEHRAILHAFTTHDPEAAVQAVTTHLEGARRRLGAALEESVVRLQL
ncbi:MAG: GntR family transcriptional regulator [Chloroflexi bacterium]|nr:GntR family transcriptional regulator [Chloroflexota bacterium]